MKAISFINAPTGWVLEAGPMGVGDLWKGNLIPSLNTSNFTGIETLVQTSSKCGEGERVFLFLVDPPDGVEIDLAIFTTSICTTPVRIKEPQPSKLIPLISFGRDSSYGKEIAWFETSEELYHKVSEWPDVKSGKTKIKTFNNNYYIKNND